MTNDLKILAESLIIRKIQYIVINYINLFVFDDEIEMKNRSTIQTLIFVQTNPDHLYMKLNMKLVVVHVIIHSFGVKKLAPCKNFSWLLNWLLTFKTGTCYIIYYNILYFTDYQGFSQDFEIISHFCRTDF
jgi:hypothetical protein